MSTDENAPLDTGPRRRFVPGAKVAAPIVAALLVGAGAAFAVDHRSSTPSAVAAGAGGYGPRGGAGGPEGFGGVAGEQHVQGTVTAKSGSSITVKSNSGTTATYTVDSTTEIVRNGTSASLSDVVVGDPVFVHVYPSSSGGRLLVERLFAGSSATNAGPGFGPPPVGGETPGTGTTGTGTTTHI